ncbi:hypothetical protein Tco_0276914 [Tanacetum coccineum]
MIMEDGDEIDNIEEGEELNAHHLVLSQFGQGFICSFLFLRCLSKRISTVLMIIGNRICTQKLSKTAIDTIGTKNRHVQKRQVQPTGCHKLSVNDNTAQQHMLGNPYTTDICTRTLAPATPAAARNAISQLPNIPGFEIDDNLGRQVQEAFQFCHSRSIPRALSKNSLSDQPPTIYRTLGLSLISGQLPTVYKSLSCFCSIFLLELADKYYQLRGLLG